MNIHILPEGIGPKVNMIARLEIELANHNVTVQHINHYAMDTHYENVNKRD